MQPRGPRARAAPTTAPPRLGVLGLVAGPVVVAARPQHLAVRIDEDRTERTVTGVERFVGQRHGRPQMAEVLLRDRHGPTLALNVLYFGG